MILVSHLFVPTPDMVTVSQISGEENSPLLISNCAYLDMWQSLWTDG